MKFYRAKLMLISFLTYMIMAGLLTQVGIIIDPMAQYLGIPITEAASIFSYLTGGTLLGTIISMFAYSKLEIRTVLRFNYLLFLVVLALIIFFNFQSAAMVSLYLLVIGACCGIGLSGGAVIISKIFNEEKRASAFIATDCAFSAAGFIFPSLTTLLIASGVTWTGGYAVVGVIVLFVFLSTFIFQYPEETSSEKIDAKTRPALYANFKSIINIRVILAGIALGLYLLAQTTFLTWAPNYLQEVFQLSSQESSLAVSNYWGPSIFGLITAAILVNKFSARYMLVIILFVAIFITTFLNLTTSATAFLYATVIFGFFTSAIYKIGISIGSQQIQNAPAILVTFLLTCGGIGSTVAPAFSAFFVGNFGIHSAMIITTTAFVVVCVLFIICLILEKQATKKL